MEKIIPFKKSEFTKSGTHISSGKYLLELQRDWEEEFHQQFHPYYANVLEGHPVAMKRITNYLEGDNSKYDAGMELIDDKMNIDTNLAIEEFSESHTIYAIGSQLHDDEDNPLFLVKNENLVEEILILKYVDDNKNEEAEPVPKSEIPYSKIKTL